MFKENSPQDTENQQQNAILQTSEMETVRTDIVEFNEVGNSQESGQQRIELRAEESTTSQYGSSVIDFLRRPVQFVDVTWTSAQQAGVSLASVALPSAWTKIPMITQKLQGFRYFRGTARIRVQVNAQPFNAGLLIIWFNPVQQSLTSPPSNESHFGGITGYRHVYLNVNKDTSSELVVPFSTNVTHYDLLSGLGEIGTVNVMIYSPLTGLDDVDLTVWVSMEDIEIEVPTGFGVVGQDQMDEEVKMSGKRVGVVSSTARIISGAAGGLSQIPALTSIMKPLGWVADSIAGAAEMFGFSKPQNFSDTTSVVQRIAPDMANFNGISQSKMLALDSRNSNQTPSSMDGSGEDQMAFAHLLRKWIYMDRYKFNQSDSQGKVIWEWPVTPYACRKTVNESRRINHETMLSYMGRSFLAWRGSIEYCFKIIATPFHTGRLEVTFVPGSLESAPVGSIDFSKVEKKIIDLRETSEFCFSVPFVHNEMWVQSNISYPENISDVRVTDSFPTGMIYVRVVNSLRRPATAADSIEILVEQRAGEDFEFAQPQLDESALIERRNLPFTTVVTDISKTSVKGFGTAGQAVGMSKMETASPVVIAEQTAAAVVTEPVPVVKQAEPVAPATIAWTQGQPLPYSHPKETVWVKTQADSDFLWMTFSKMGAYSDSASGLDSFKEKFKVLGRDEMNDMHEFIRKQEKPSPEFDKLGMGEKITSIRQVLKRYNELPFQVPLQQDGDGVAIYPYTTGWSVDGNTPTADVTWLGFLDWYTSLFRWQSGSMRMAFSVRTGQATDLADSTVSVFLRPPTSVGPAIDQGIFSVTNLTSSYTGAPKVLLYPDNERFMEVTIPFYSHLPAILTGVGKPNRADYLEGPLLNKMPTHYGGLIVVENKQNLVAYRSIGEDFNLDYSLGPPLTSVTYQETNSKPAALAYSVVKRAGRHKANYNTPELRSVWKEIVRKGKETAKKFGIFKENDLNALV